MVTGRQSPGRAEPSPPPPLSCDPGQVRKVSWAGAAPRLADLSAAGEGAEAGAPEEAPCSGGLRAPPRHFCFLPGGSSAAAGVATALCGARAAGAPGRSAVGEVWAEPGGWWEWEPERRAGAREMESRARGPGTRGGDLARAGWWGPPKGCAAGARGLGTGECGIWGLGDPRGCAGEGTGGSDPGISPALADGRESLSGCALGSGQRGAGGMEGPKGQEEGTGAAGTLGRQLLNTRLAGTRRGLPWGHGTKAGGKGASMGDPGMEEGHPARLQGRGQRGSGGPGIRAERGGGDR